MSRNIPLTIVTIVLVGVAISFFLRKSDPNRPVMISSAWAPGQSLAVTDIKWTTLWDQHALTVNISSTGEAIRLMFPETAFVGICNEILQRMPRAPLGILQADVYRVNIRKLGTQTVNYPMPVADGRCLDWKAGTELFPYYPPPLENWRLNSYEVFSEGKNMGTTFVFAAAPGPGSIVEGKTFADACHAMLTEQVLAGRNMADYIEGKVARIKLARFVGPAVLNFGTWQTRDFKVLSGKCIPVDEDSKT